MMAKTRWGMVGTGSIAHRFANGLSVVEDAELVAVASRTQASADAFGNEFGVARRWTTVSQLAQDPEVDVVYVATPHPRHMADTLTLLDAGKPVLCEKPFAMNAAESMAMISRAREKKVFLMEAMWTCFFPAIIEMRRLIASHAIGEIRQVKADLCFSADFNPASRLFDPQLGGGSLLDVGIYTIAFARMVFGKQPATLHALPHIGQTGVDEQAAMIFRYDSGALAMLSCSLRTETPHEAVIYGTNGYIRIPHMFWQPDQIVVKIGAGNEKVISFDRHGNGYNYEAVEVMQCLQKGALQSSVVPWDMTMDVASTMDEIRAQWGLVYPMEASSTSARVRAS